MITISNLSLIKRKKSKTIKILENISLEVSSGKISLLLGKSGSGKTTILRCITQIEQKYEGTILYKGQKMEELNRKQRCQIIGFVPQNYALFPFMNVLNNCAQPLKTVLGYDKKMAYRKAEEMLCSFNMEKLIHSYPHELSGGQQQRTSIIRALLLNPIFLLLDEPTSALDPENTTLLIQILLKLKSEGQGVIVSSQDMSFARKIFDSAYFFQQGKLIENYQAHVATTDLSKDSNLHSFLFESLK